MAQVSFGSRFKQWDIGRQTHPVDVTPGTNIVQSIDDNRKLFEELDVIFSILNGINDGLNAYFLVCTGQVRVSEPFQGNGGSSLCFALSDMRFVEEELSVEVGDIDCVHVDHEEVREPFPQQCFDDLASDASCSHQKDLGPSDPFDQ